MKQRDALNAFSRPHSLAAAISRALLCSVLAMPLLAMAENAAPASEYVLPAGALGTALGAFAAQAGVVIYFDAAITSGLQSPPLQGQYGVEAGLANLLRGSGLRAVKKEDGSYTLVRDEQAEVQLAPVKVNASVESAVGPVDGYVAKRSATGTKTDTPLIETPQSISVIGREEIEAKGMRDLLDTLNYTPGVFTRTYGHDDRGVEFVTLRGFQNTDSFTHNYLDGLSQLDFANIMPVTEVYGMERVEVLRGPASTTFGRGDVGGVVNRVSKRPSLNDPVGEVQVQLGTFKYQQIAADYGDRIGENVAYRLVGLERSSDDQAEYPSGERVETERQYFAPSMLWQPSEATSLILLASYIRHDAGDDTNYLADADGQPTDIRDGDPDYSRVIQKAWTLGYEFRHDFNDTWGFRQNARYADRDLEKHFTRPAILQADGRTIRRTAIASTGDMQQLSIDSFVVANFETGNTTHELIMGVDWNQMDAEEQELTGPAPDLDLFDPVYQPIPEPTAPGRRYGPAQTSDLGIYVQDQVKLGEQWILTLSGRHDTAEVEDESWWRDEPEERTDRDFTGRVGLTWLASNEWAPYVSYGTSFQPAFGVFDGLTDEPTTGEQLEAGIKYQPQNGKMLFTAAIYDLEKKNIVVTNPTTLLSEQVGSVRSRGLELEAKGELMPGLLATAAYAYTDVEGQEGDTWYVEEGKTPVLSPEHTASLWLNYTFHGTSLAGLNMGFGARYVGKRWDDAANTESQPSYTLFDARLAYDLNEQWRLALNATNMFDKRYYASNIYNGWYRGEERTATFTATYHF